MFKYSLGKYLKGFLYYINIIFSFYGSVLIICLIDNVPGISATGFWNGIKEDEIGMLLLEVAIIPL